MDDEAAARKSYEEFLSLWKDADSDIPIYQQAKGECAGLHGASELSEAGENRSVFAIAHDAAKPATTVPLGSQRVAARNGVLNLL